MNRIERKFEQLRQQRKKAFVAFITAGDPNLKITRQLVGELERCGVDIVELGVPFSDPLADGPVIQQASMRALCHGVNLHKILDMVRDMRGGINIPLVLMTYYNPVLQYGLEKFATDASKSGIDGVIVPDLPPEEAEELIRPLYKKGINPIFLLSPTSTRERIKMVAALSKGFIYYVSLTGITGPRERLPLQIHHDVRLIKHYTDLPVCVGFGISRPDQARSLVRSADGIIVGSAIIRELERNLAEKDKVNKVINFVSGLVQATKGHTRG